MQNNKTILPFKQKEIIGKDVYFENGMKLGGVVGIKEINDGKELKYHIEVYGDDFLSIPIEQIEITDKALIYKPIWVLSIVKRVEEIEERLKLLNFEGGEIENLNGKIGYENYIKCLEEMNEIYNELPTKLKNLEIEKEKIENETARLYGKKLLKEITRREFSKALSNLKKKLEINNLNMEYCKELIQKIDKIHYKKFNALEDFQILKQAKYKCPKCRNIILIEENKRPIIINCSNCGIKGIIKE